MELEYSQRKSTYLKCANLGIPVSTIFTLSLQVVLVVNVASKCGFTKQYAGLESIYQKYHDKGFEIIGAPCNQFNNQGNHIKLYAYYTSCLRNTFFFSFAAMQSLEILKVRQAYKKETLYHVLIVFWITLKKLKSFVSSNTTFHFHCFKNCKSFTIFNYISAITNTFCLSDVNGQNEAPLYKFLKESKSGIFG